jgi:hypothetical protein|tara:strand:- start:14 stop:439 length:426 start_codon:yes stop_codon:yes gene_type:complete
MSNYVMNAERMKKEGKKFDSEKPMMQLLPSKALVEVSKVLSFGANKYGKENWRELDDLQDRYTGGTLRHIFAHMDDEFKDPETNYSHLAHAVCGLLFKLEIELEKDKEERLRESISAEHRESDSTAKPEFFGKTYNKETGV